MPTVRLLPLLLLLLAAACSQPRPVETADARPDTTDGPRANAPETMGPVFAGPMRADPVYSAATLVEAMHDRHAGSWYRTVSFTQRTHQRQPDGTISTETWREWAALPGRLRIEMGDPMEGLDALFVADSAYTYRDGRLAAARAERNPLLLWGFDVYAQPPAETLRVLEAEGVDLASFREDVWDGQRAYVVGVPETGEVWVERDRLLFVRLVEPGQGGALQDVRFENYERLGGGWVAPYVSVRQGDRIVFWEVYSDLVADPALDPVLFEPRRWAEGVAASR